MENFQANDQLTLAVDQMQAALPFENDVARKKELQAEMENTLSQLADRGDYENLGFAVHKTARDFGQKYAPIKENYTRYQAALTDLSERYKKGDINSQQYQLSGAYIAKNYKGFEIDPTTGKVKDGTMFSAPTIVKDPKLMDLIKERLEILHADKYANTIKRVNWAEGDAGAIEVETSNGVETISLDKIQDVVQAVYAEPDVKAYVDQLADMKAYTGLKGQDIPTVVQGQTQSYLDGIAKLKETIATGKLNRGEIAAYQEQINKYNQEIQTLSGIQDEAGAHDYFKNKFKDEILAPVTQYANKKAYTYQESSYKENWSARYLQDRELMLKNPTLTRQGDVNVGDVNGASFLAKKELMASNWNAAQEKLKMSQDMALSEGARAKALEEYNSYMGDNEQIKSELINAANKVVTFDDIKAQDEKSYETLKALYPWASAGELYLKAIETFDSPGDQDFIDFQNKYKEKFGNTYEFTQSTNQQEEKPLSGFEKGIASITVSPAGAMASPNYTAYNAAQTTMNPPLTFGIGLATKFNGKINKTISETKASVPFEYGSIPTANPQDGVIIRKAIDGYFLGKPLAANDMFTEVTENGVESKAGSEYSDYEVGQVGWNSTRNIYEIQLNKKGDKSSTKTIHMDGRTLSNPELDQLTNDPNTKFAGAIYESLTGLSPGESTRRLLQLTFSNEKGQLDQKPLYLNILARDSYEDAVLTITNPDGSPVVNPKTGGVTGMSTVIKDANGNDIIVPKKMLLNEKYLKEIVQYTLPGTTNQMLKVY
jgi:hypothetical protein